MALANHRVRHFQDIQSLNYFIQNDADIASVVSIVSSNSGGYVLIYTV
jgi:hypothetical protein